MWRLPATVTFKMPAVVLPEKAIILITDTINDNPSDVVNVGEQTSTRNGTKPLVRATKASFRNLRLTGGSPQWAATRSPMKCSPWANSSKAARRATSRSSKSWQTLGWNRWSAGLPLLLRREPGASLPAFGSVSRSP